MNKVWEVIEREARDGSHRESRYPSYRKGMRKDTHDDDTSYRYGMRDDDVKEAYECGFEDGYSEAMKKIFHIIKDAD